MIREHKIYGNTVSLVRCDHEEQKCTLKMSDRHLSQAMKWMNKRRQHHVVGAICALMDLNLLLSANKCL